MQKGDMSRLVTMVALMTLAALVEVMDAAPLSLLGQGLSTAGDQKPPDPWTSGPDIQERTEVARGSLERLLKTVLMTTNPDVRGKIMPATRNLDRQMTIDPATSSPDLTKKTLAPTGRLGRRVKIASMAIDSNRHEKIVPATSSLDRPLRTEPTTGGPDTQESTVIANGSIYRRLKIVPMTTDSNEQGKTVSGATSVGRRLKINPVTSSPDRREKIMKMLTALEELHRTINTLSSKLTMIPRANGRSSGKKSKTVIAEGTLKATTMPSVDSSGTASRASTDLIDPHSLTGKALKKSLPTPPKKTNKRVCFWKYCSQN